MTAMVKQENMLDEDDSGENSISPEARVKIKLLWVAIEFNLRAMLRLSLSTGDGETPHCA